MKQINLFKLISTLIGFFIVGWLALMRPDWILVYGYLTCIPGYLLLLFVITPAGHVKFGHDEPLPFLKWFSKLVLAQFVMLIFTIAALVAFMSAGPGYSLDQINYSTAETTIKQHLIWWGIFPWGIIGFWAIVIAYIKYIKKGEPFFYQIARGFSPRLMEPLVKTYIEGCVTGATILAFSLIATAAILLISGSIETYFQVHHYLIPMVTFTVISFLVPIILFKFVRKRFQRWTRHVNLKQIVAFCLILLVPVILFAAWLNQWVVGRHPELYKIQCEQCQLYFANIPIELRFTALLWGWWFIWTPFCGAYLASISNGRTLREFILGLYIIPLICFLIYLRWGYLPFEVLVRTLSAGFARLIAYGANMSGPELAIYQKAAFLMLLGLMSSWFLLRLVRHYRDNAVLYVGPMTLEPNAPKGRKYLHQNSKITGLSKEANKLIMTIIGTLFLHTISGWYGIQIQVVAMAVLVLNAVYIGSELLILRFFKDKTWIGNQNIPPY